MSFLAQLRQQKSANYEGLRLCYLFEIGDGVNWISVRLALAEIKAGQLIKVVKPYRVQKQHLLHPPDFLSEFDCELLEQLDVATEGWQNEQGELMGCMSAVCVTQLMQTQRAFILCANGQWKNIGLKTPVRIRLEWNISLQADYRLQWKAEASKGKLMSFKYDRSFFVYYHAADSGISLVEHDFSELAYQQFFQIESESPALSIDDYITRNKSTFENLGLPLPKPAEQRFVFADIFPVLKLSNFNHAQFGVGGKLGLMFRYISCDYCGCVSAEDKGESLYYWSGENIGVLKRDKTKEKQLAEYLFSLLDGFELLENSYERYNNKKSAWLKFFTETLFILKQAGFDFLIEKDFSYHYVLGQHWQVEVSDTENKSLRLELSVEVDNSRVYLNELIGQLQIFNQKMQSEGTTLTLDDGRLLLLPAGGFGGLLDELADIIEGNGRMEIPRRQFNRLAEIKQQLPESTSWKGDKALLDLACSLSETPQIIDQILKGVKADLRPYQWLGVCWLQHLKRHGVNGLLADDMGLGKTLQTLAHLSLEHQQGSLKKPVLIVVPTSLLHNWAAEIKSFTPTLKFKIMHGPKRHEAWEGLGQYHIILTSYQLVLNDLEQWKMQALSWVVLDEAQQIKNSKTFVSQSLRQIDSDFRLCLSGTPVENHLGELWSLLDFLMPGCLGTLSDFKDFFRKPIELEGDNKRMAQLQKRIAPFILRRTKEQVASDLPEKTIIYQTINLSEQQLAFYEEQKHLEQEVLEKEFHDNEHAGQKQIRLLTALMKLRQVCCDPALLGRSDIESAKRQYCLDMIQELVEEGRKILLFSQFTRMLDLLAADLGVLGIEYLMLTGQNRNRQQLVDRFQEGVCPVFLMSLKAGGVGLNLTEADTVIHYDPWWNSAAEQQAADRTHRIGQKKPVFVYKLISGNTIEEKIVLLQQHKARLSEHINQQAQLGGEQFALKLEDLLSLWQQETNAC